MARTQSADTAQYLFIGLLLTHQLIYILVRYIQSANQYNNIFIRSSLVKYDKKDSLHQEKMCSKKTTTFEKWVFFSASLNRYAVERRLSSVTNNRKKRSIEITLKVSSVVECLAQVSAQV